MNREDYISEIAKRVGKSKDLVKAVEEHLFLQVRKNLKTPREATILLNKFGNIYINPYFLKRMINTRYTFAKDQETIEYWTEILNKSFKHLGKNEEFNATDFRQRHLEKESDELENTDH